MKPKSSRKQYRPNNHLPALLYIPPTLLRGGGWGGPGPLGTPKTPLLKTNWGE